MNSHARARRSTARSRAAAPAEQAEPDELSALKRRVKSGGAKEGDLLRYLELTGAAE
ncbi:hypothetical protein [Fundidesulfovibrio magnetotacticus]|uniref:hypothetical protein n=1 Tax=Fundidesulfovibrio magnetotacticus TaxID=2730080 RepID=UPI001563F8A0|nr:hypothetical protein [Fundidesulfovibrio magnetotacticus]